MLEKAAIWRKYVTRQGFTETDDLNEIRAILASFQLADDLFSDDRLWGIFGLYNTTGLVS